MGNQPHDGLFRRIFGDLEHAKSLLQSFLPISLAEAVNFSTLENHSTRFVNKRLKKTESDLIFSALYKNSEKRLFVYFLIEHQSSPDEWMPLRLLLYVGEVYDWCRRQDPTAKKLPFVFPIVFYHGERKWNAPSNFRELVDIPEPLQGAIQAFVPDFYYRLEDLSPYNDEALSQLQLTACARAVLSVLKHIFDRDLAAKLPEILGDLTSWLATINGYEEFSVVLRYIIDTNESVEFSDLEEWRKGLSPDATRVIMTLADQLRAEGHAKGLVEGLAQGEAKGLAEGEAKGLAEGEAKGLARGEAEGFAKGEVKGLAEAIINIFTARSLEVPDETRRAIFSCGDVSILERWLRRALTVEASNDIFRDG